MTRDFANSTYFDRTFNRQAVKILPGEYHATAADTMIVTVLGSCVSVCLRDRLTGIGGMNHFMLLGHGAESPSARYGVKAMEVLLEHLKHLGADHSRLEAKVFGVGARCGGCASAQGVFSPRTGRVMVRRIRACADDAAAQ